MLEAQSFRRALDDAGLEKADIEGLASAGYGGMHEVHARRVPRAHAALARVVERRRVELRVPHDARVPRHPGRRRRHRRDRLRQQPAVGVGPHARHRRRRRRRARRDAVADGATSSRPGSRSSARTRWPRSGTCTSTAPRPSSSRRSRCRPASTRPATRTRCTATRSPSTTCSSSRLVADPLHKLDCCVISDGGCCIILTTEERARDLAHQPGVRARRGRRHDAPLDPGDGRHDAHRRPR